MNEKTTCKWREDNGVLIRKDGIRVHSRQAFPSLWACLDGPDSLLGLRWSSARQAMDAIDRKIPYWEGFWHSSRPCCFGVDHAKPGEDFTRTFRATNALRWVDRETTPNHIFSSSKRVMQQAWECVETGETHWCDVPTEKEE